MKDMFALIACVCGLVATLLGFAMNPLAYLCVGVAMVHLGIWFYLTWCEQFLGASAPLIPVMSPRDKARVLFYLTGNLAKSCVTQHNAV